ncbi:hypothetical protein BC628DRAFT_1399718 [Trametes gibbosa]|nr:hypothetical protein BC628DRAFT_1399718 [Trametes gibbosa]
MTPEGGASVWGDMLSQHVAVSYPGDEHSFVGILCGEISGKLSLLVYWLIVSLQASAMQASFLR